LAAATLGIEVLEVHVTFSKEMFGPDVPASITFSELRQLVEGIRFIEVMTHHPLEKDQVAEEMSQMRKLFTKSVVANRDLDAGTILRAGDLTGKKPGTGIPSRRLPEFLGRTLKRPIKANELLQEADFL
jgi:N-acetylneuraminate synthase